MKMLIVILKHRSISYGLKIFFFWGGGRGGVIFFWSLFAGLGKPKDREGKGGNNRGQRSHFT